MSNPMRSVSNRRIPALPGNSSNAIWMAHKSNHSLAVGTDASPEMVKEYLLSNPHVLEAFINEHVSEETLRTLLYKKALNARPKTPAQAESFPQVCLNGTPMLAERYLDFDIREVQSALEKEIYQKHELEYLLVELSSVLAGATKADTSRLYVLRNGGIDLCQYQPGQRDALVRCGPVGMKSTVAAHVAHTKQTVVVRELAADERFPKGVFAGGDDVQSVLCLPVVLPSDDILGVIELIRNWENLPFGELEIQVATTILSWVGTAIHQSQVNKGLMKQRELNDFLLHVSRIIFDDIVAMDMLIENIMLFAKNLVDADRCALFLVDEVKKEIYADMFDEGKEENGKPIFTKKQQPIRFSVEKGIAGHVAMTGEVVNIAKAYEDSRFNREIDKATGYTTHNILCMPIISKKNIIGVVQMINKRSGSHFTNTDEQSFKMFAVYCAMALHYSKVYGALEETNNKYKVALEQLIYHSTPSEDECRALENRPVPKVIPEEFDRYEFFYKGYDAILPHLSLLMIHNLLGEDCFDMKKLCRFVLTVRKNYRDVTYHNWKHGFNVAHCMYWILSRTKHLNFLSHFEMQGLLIASLCHDLDHRGYNNAYFTKSGSPLADLYSTSVMERHHYQITVHILQQEGTDIFSHLSTAKYKRMLEIIEEAILNTDLALYFPCQKQLAKMVLEETIDIHQKECKEKVVGLMMTAADLCAVCKLWPVQQETVKYIYEEFYTQGDREKNMGLEPLPMMDRKFTEEMPKQQVGFIQFVCLPCYNTIADILPPVTPLAEGVRDNLTQWQRVVAGKSTAMWEPGRSRLQEGEGKNEEKD